MSKASSTRVHDYIYVFLIIDFFYLNEFYVKETCEMTSLILLKKE